MKIEKQVLSIEQMKHLQELGVDTSDASMYWVRAKRITGEQKNNCIDRDMGKWKLSLSKSMVLPAAWALESVPTYTIDDLIEKLYDNIGRECCFEIISFYKTINYGYRECYDGKIWKLKNIISFSGETLVEALYKLLCWIIENQKELLEVKMTKTTYCGECEKFLYEDTDGFGICGKTNEECRCSDKCHLINGKP